MHYAVSHSNFDVVSILLDSKVCNINKVNKAGYTSVMLVTLTEIRSQEHTTVVKRLFQMADVNLRARQVIILKVVLKNILNYYFIAAWPNSINVGR